jgi:hypothetical protein
MIADRTQITHAMSGDEDDLHDQDDTDRQCDADPNHRQRHGPSLCSLREITAVESFVAGGAQCPELLRVP